MKFPEVGSIVIVLPEAFKAFLILVTSEVVTVAFEPASIKNNLAPFSIFNVNFFPEALVILFKISFASQ